LGGCAGNIAVGCARLGLKTVMYSCVGRDEMGQFLINELQKEGVSTELVTETQDNLTGLVLLGIKPPHEFPLMFYRKDCADMQISADKINESHLKKTKALLITGTGISTKAMRDTTMEVIALAKKCETQVILDLDYRPVLWGLMPLGDGETRYCSNQEVSLYYQSILPFCDLIVGTEEELCIAGGAEHLNAALKAVQSLSSAPIVLKSGEKGCAVHWSSVNEVLYGQAFPVEVLNVLGAGDGFMAGLLTGLLGQASWEKSTSYANASGALVVTRHGCAPAIPFRDELEYFIEQYPKNPKVWASDKLAQLHERSIRPTSESPLIKNPFGFAEGINLIVGMNDAYHKTGMNYSCLKLSKGQTHVFDERFEFAALLMTGKVSFYYANQNREVERYDYWSQIPKVLHSPSGQTARVLALTDCEIMLIETENAHQFETILFDETNILEVDNRGKDLLEDSAYRLVRTVFDKRNRPESNLVVGEIISFQGRWSSYPSHYHPQPEIYHYRFSEPQGYAFGEKGKEVLRIEHYDTYAIPGGMEHAHCVAPGYALYTLWFIRHLQDKPYFQPTFHKEHEWTRDASANMRMCKPKEGGI
jgi:5-dehydro-2-deoxygluconokinase